jgi:predicted transcriptional regulator
MQHFIGEVEITPLEIRVLRFCTKFAPRVDGDDQDNIAKALHLAPSQVRRAVTHLQDLGLLKRTLTKEGVPVIVTLNKDSSQFFR